MSPAQGLLGGSRRLGQLEARSQRCLWLQGLGGCGLNEPWEKGMGNADMAGNMIGNTLGIFFKWWKMWWDISWWWWFPELGVPPSHHPFEDGNFHEMNHPAIGYPHLWKPPYGGKYDRKYFGTYWYDGRCDETYHHGKWMMMLKGGYLFIMGNGFVWKGEVDYGQLIRKT